MFHASPPTPPLTSGANARAQHDKRSNGPGPVGGATTETDSFNPSRHNIAYYSELLGNPDDRFSYTLSGRVDDNSDYHRFNTDRPGGHAGRRVHNTAVNASAFW